MNLTVKCPGCEKALRVPDSAAGKAIKCPLCAKLFKLPDAPAASAAVMTAPPPVPPPPKPPALPQPPKRPDAVRRVTTPPEEDELELEPSVPQALPFLPIEFKATVKDPTKTMKGVYQGKVSRAGLVLRQGKKVVEVPVGTEAEYIKANRMAVELEQGRVELTIVKVFHYFNQLTEDMVAFLNGEKRTLDIHDYRMPWYLYAPAVLPLGIPILTLGGALPAGIGAGLAGACFGIAQQRKLPVAARIAASVALSAAAYALLFILIGVGTLHSWAWSPGVPDSQPGPNGAQATPAELQPLIQGVRRIDQASIRKLAQMGPAAQAAVPELTAMLGDDRLKVWAAEALLGIQPGNPAALTALRQGLKLPMPAPAARAACLLFQMDPNDKEVLPVLAKSLKMPFSDTSARTAQFLGDMGPAAKPIVPALTEALKNPTGMVAAAEALRKIDPAGSSAVALQGLIDALKATNPAVCMQAAEALGKLGPEAKTAVPALQAMAKDPKRPELHAPATAALQKIEGRP